MNEFNFGMGASSSGRSTTVREFLESVTEVGELVVIRSGGWKECAAYIDHEDYFRLPGDIARRKVQDSSFGTIKVTTRGPLPMDVPVRFVDC